MTEKRNYWNLGMILFIVFFCLYYCVNKNLPQLLMDAIFPLVIGGAIAYVINILMSFYERWFFAKNVETKLKRPVSLIIALITIIIVVWLLIMLIVPQFISCIRTLLQKAPATVETLLSMHYFRILIPDNLAEQMENFNWDEIIKQTVELLSSLVPGITGTVSSVFSGIVTLLFSLIFAFYFLIGKDIMRFQIQRVMKNYLEPIWCYRINHWAQLLNTSFHNFITGQCLEAIILGSLCFIGMVIFKFPYAGLIGVFVGITGLLPMLGAYLGAFVGAFMILSVSPQKALLFLVFLVVLQQIEGNLIYPKVVGTSVGLPALWTLAAVTVGGTLDGILGMFLGVPIASAFYQGLKEDMKLKEEKEKKEMEEYQLENKKGVSITAKK